MDIPAWREENLAKNFGGKWQKFDKEPSSNRREREKSLRTFEKWGLNKSRSDFKKLIHDFQLIENQFRLIETDRGSHKILTAISIDQKTYWINWNSGKTAFLKK